MSIARFISSWKARMSSILEIDIEDRSEVFPLLKGYLWCQKLWLHGTRLSGLSIQFATYARENKSTVNIMLTDRSGIILHKEIINGYNIIDNAFRELSFTSCINLDCNECYLWIWSNDGGLKDSLAVWRNKVWAHNNAFLINGFDGSCSVNADIIKHSGVKYSGGISCRVNIDSSVQEYNRYMLPDFNEFTCVRRTRIIHYGLDSLLLNDIALKDYSCVRYDPSGLSLNSHTDVCVIPAIENGSEYGRIIMECRRNFIPVIGCFLDHVPSDYASHPERLSGVFDAILAPTRVDQDCRMPWLVYCASDANEDLATFEDCIERSCEIYHKKFLPKVSIVTVLYSKEKQIDVVLDSYFGQTYQGDIEVIFVDDASRDRSVNVVEAYFESKSKQNPEERSVEFKIVRNGGNFGNCISRNRGLMQATGDICIVIDADCLLNKGFVQHHVSSHSYNDCEIVIGPLNIETNGAPPREVMSSLEKSSFHALQSSEMQDSINLTSFLNCITRNFSIKRSAIREQLFDPDFSYSADPKSGFGWEDVEMGYRLYLQGARVKFTEGAFALHMTHSSSVPEREKPIRSLRNFRKLFDKHPLLGLEARRWSLETYEMLNKWLERTGQKGNEDTKVLDAYFEKISPSHPYIRKQRQLRVLTYRWHVPHQYELYKLPHHFTLVTGLGAPMTDSWEYGHRPMPGNAIFADVASVDTNDYDLAILHFDENVLSYENCNGKLGADWGAAFRWFCENVDLPKVAICHGTPQFHGQYDPDYDGDDFMQVIEPARQRLVDYVGDMEIVCNSHQAQREWGFNRSRVIWHGFDPTEFPPATYERGILSPLGPLVVSRPHYRGYHVYKEVFDERFPKDLLPDQLVVPDPDIEYEGNTYAIWKFKNYVDQIRRYSIYFNPTLRSPMPRARCEPMMCGVVTVNANNHDVDMFIKNGVNGFYSNDPNELRDQLVFLSRRPDVLKRMGYEARKTALNIFNHDRYLGEWTKLISELI